jgi:hypothetical protein
VTVCAPVAPRTSSELIHDEGTLDELVVAVWERLSADRSATCPLCGGEMRPQYGAHARAIGGSCSSCGASLH